MRYQAQNILAIALIIILGFFIYANSLNGKFIWDDNILVRDDIFIRHISGISKFFIQGLTTSVSGHLNFYRPIQMLTYMFDYFLWKLDVRGYHITNIILHIFVATAIFWLIYILYNNRILSLLTAILFVVHPVHTEAVSYISGRADLLAALFMLLCIIFYIKYLQLNNGRFFSLMIFTYILALLSKENSIIVPVLVLIYHYTFRKKKEKKAFVSLLAVTFIYAIVRLTVFKSHLIGSAAESTVLQRLPGFFIALANYIRLLILPFGLHMEYGNRIFDFTNLWAIAGAIISVFLLFIVLRTRTKKESILFFSISWFIITLMPFSNLYPINAYMAEHWLYLPSIGFFLPAAKGISKIYDNKNLKMVAILLIAGLIIYYSHLTVVQNNYWSQPIAFYERALKYAADSSRLYGLLCNAYKDAGDNNQPIRYYKKAIEIDPKNAMAYNNLGSLYRIAGETREALASYHKAAEINPEFADCHNNLGILYKSTGNTKEAIASYKKAIEIDPYNWSAYYNIGNAYASINKNEDAITAYKKSIEINPDNADCYYNLSVIYYRQKRGGLR